MIDNKKYYIWGFGGEAKKCNSDFLMNVDGIVDQNEALQGKCFYNNIIESPDDVLGKKNIFFIVLVIYEYDEIKKILINNGYIENVDFIWAPYWEGNERIPSPYYANEWKTYDGTIDFTEDKWMKRAKMAVKMVSGYKSVADMGAGAMTIKKLLGNTTQYYPVDYLKRFDETIVCDFNKGEYPDLSVDVVFALGVMEYISDTKMFVKKICDMTNTIVMSYNCIEKNDNYALRKSNGWKNHYKIIEIIDMFSDNGFKLVDERMYGGIGIIFKFQNVINKR